MTSKDFEPVICYFDWWDCPRFGVALMDGAPYYFECNFSEELDDYPTEYELWPIDADSLRREIDQYSVITKWKSAFESGAAPISLEHDVDFAAENSALNDGPRRKRTAVRKAVPEWRLDRTRSHTGRVPQHHVRWRLMPEP